MTFVNLTIKKAAAYTIPFLITFLFLYFAFRNIDFEVLKDYLSDISIYYSILFLFVFTLSHYLRAVRWKYIINSVKQDTEVVNLMGSLMIGYGVNCVIPRLGEIFRALFLGKLEKISRSSMFGTIIVERVIDTIVLILFVFLSALIYDGNIYEKISWLQTSVILVSVIISLVLVFIVLTVSLKEKFSELILNFISKFSEKIAGKLSIVFEMFINGFSTIKSRKDFIFITLYSFFIMGAYILNAYIGFYIVGMQNCCNITFSMAVIVMVLGAFGVVIPTPGGTGAYHAIVILVLTNLYAFNQEMSATYAIITHFITYFSFIIYTIIFYYLINFNQKKKGEEKLDFISAFSLNKNE